LEGRIKLKMGNEEKRKQIFCKAIGPTPCLDSQSVKMLTQPNLIVNIFHTLFGLLYYTERWQVFKNCILIF